MLLVADHNRTPMTAGGFPTGANSLNGTNTYTYDGRNELTKEVSTRYYTNGLNYSYQYDGATSGTTTGAGNGTNIADVTFTFNSDNQITGDRFGNAYAYDGDGNPTTYEGQALTFDPENRMTAYEVPVSGHATLTAGYTGDGMRAWKENASATRTYFLYDGTTLLAELGVTGALSAYQTTGANDLISRRVETTSDFYTYDPTGSVATATNSAGTVTDDELFDAVGAREDSYNTRPVDFIGQWGYYKDQETLLTLCGHRYYDYNADTAAP